MSTISEKLAELISIHPEGISQSDLAEKAGVPRITISRNHKKLNDLGIQHKKEGKERIYKKEQQTQTTLEIENTDYTINIKKNILELTLVANVTNPTQFPLTRHRKFVRDTTNTLPKNPLEIFIDDNPIKIKIWNDSDNHELRYSYEIPSGKHSIKQITRYKKYPTQTLENNGSKPIPIKIRLVFDEKEFVNIKPYLKQHFEDLETDMAFDEIVEKRIYECKFNLNPSVKKYQVIMYRELQNLIH